MPALATGEVHVWRAPLAVPEDVRARLAALLSDDEERRAARKRFPHLRSAARVSAGVLRDVLARYVGTGARELAFGRGQHGKPFLESPADDAPAFNLTHTDAWLLVAIRREGALGVDAERVVPERVDEPLAERVLGARELALWRGAPMEERVRLFFRAWTCKEASVKAAGSGLSADPREVEVLVAGPEGAPRLAPEVALAAGSWALRELEPALDHAAALALPSRLDRMRTLAWVGPDAA